MEKVHEYEKCHCVWPKAPDRKVRFMDMVPTDFVSDNCGVEFNGELHILTSELKGNISIVSEPEWQEIEITVDSGACDIVMPTRMCAHISIVATAKSRSGFEYEAANGDGLLNMGIVDAYDDGELGDTRTQVIIHVYLFATQRSCVMSHTHSGLGFKTLVNCTSPRK